MARLAERDRCSRCGALDDVRDVRYVRGGRHLTEPWCEPCRRAKLVRADKGGARKPAKGLARTALVILPLGALAAVALLVVRLLS